MGYVAPFIDYSGLHVNSYQDILATLLGSYRGVYGNTVYLSPDSSDYQFISTIALQIADMNSALQIVYLAFNTMTAIGASLDLIGVVIGVARKPAVNSTATVTISGVGGTIITNAQVLDQNGNYWNLPSSVTIGGGGSVNVTAIAINPGPISANPGTITIIGTPTLGWTDVTNADPASLGQSVESDAAYRARLRVAQAIPSKTLIAGTAAAVAALSGVTRSQVYDNPTGSADGDGIPAHSLSVVVEGGVDADVALAIYKNKGIGCGTYGTTTVVVDDPLNGAITQSVNFFRVAYLKIFVAVQIHELSGYSTAVGDDIVSNIVNYLNSFTIGEDVIYSEVYGAAVAANTNSLAPTFAMRSFTIGSLTKETTATLNATTTIVVADATGVANGQVAVGAGIPVGATVASHSGTSIVLSAAATTSGSGVDVEFFTLVAANTDITIAFNAAALGQDVNVQLTTV